MGGPIGEAGGVIGARAGPAVGGRGGSAAGGGNGPERTREATDEEGDAAIANVTAARAFLLGEWMGATMMLLSFAQLYVIVFGRLGSAEFALAVGAALLLTGSLVYVRSKTYYDRIGLPLGHKFHIVALIVAGSAAVFWLLFLVLAILVWQGVEVT